MLPLSLEIFLPTPLALIYMSLYKYTALKVDWCSNPGPVKSYLALQTDRQCFNIYASSYVVLALRHGEGHLLLAYDEQ